MEDARRRWVCRSRLSRVCGCRGEAGKDPQDESAGQTTGNTQVIDVGHALWNASVTEDITWTSPDGTRPKHIMVDNLFQLKPTDLNVNLIQKYLPETPSTMRDGVSAL